MSFIMAQIACKDCKQKHNVALGTFGYGMPESCGLCGGKFEIIAYEWDSENDKPEEKKQPIP